MMCNLHLPARCVDSPGVYDGVGLHPTEWSRANPGLHPAPCIDVARNVSTVTTTVPATSVITVMTTNQTIAHLRNCPWVSRTGGIELAIHSRRATLSTDLSAAPGFATQTRLLFVAWSADFATQT